MESSIRGNLFFIPYSVEHGNLILYYDYPLVHMTVTQYTTTLHQIECFLTDRCDSKLGWTDHTVLKKRTNSLSIIMSSAVTSPLQIPTEQNFC